VVAENPSREADALAFAAQLRREDISAELYTTGSPRKRYDRAIKAQPAAIASFDVRDGIPSAGLRLVGQKSEQTDRAQQCFDRFNLGLTAK
jgi:histidyl-tRNA synthetase